MKSYSKSVLYLVLLLDASTQSKDRETELAKKRCNSVFEKSSELLKCQFEITSVNTAVIFFSFMPLCFILQGIEYFRYLRDHLLKVFIASSIA